MRRWLAPLFVALSAALLLWWYSQPSKLNHPAVTRPSTTQSFTAAEPKSAPEGSGEKVAEVISGTPAEQAAVPAVSQPAPSASAPVAALTPELANLPPSTVLENLRITVRQYGAMFGGNPVGTNPEITSALQGANPKNINFLKDDGNRVNSQGELVDVWGTPYFFHQLSGTETEIRSAGPDRIMYTADDLVIK